MPRIIWMFFILNTKNKTLRENFYTMIMLVLRSPHQLGTVCTVLYVFASVCVYMHAPRDMRDLSGTGTSQGATAVEIQFSAGDRRGSKSMTA